MGLTMLNFYDNAFDTVDAMTDELADAIGYLDALNFDASAALTLAKRVNELIDTEVLYIAFNDNGYETDYLDTMMFARSIVRKERADDRANVAMLAVVTRVEKTWMVETKDVTTV